MNSFSIKYPLDILPPVVLKENLQRQMVSSTGQTPLPSPINSVKALKELQNMPLIFRIQNFSQCEIHNKWSKNSGKAT